MFCQMQVLETEDDSYSDDTGTLNSRGLSSLAPCPLKNEEGREDLEEGTSAVFQ